MQYCYMMDGCACLFCFPLVSVCVSLLHTYPFSLLSGVLPLRFMSVPVQMMAKENQAVTSEVTRLVAERDDGRRKLGDALHNQATAEQVR